jgi:pimeloyl-ACP methyl ester carboxylesterase
MDMIRGTTRYEDLEQAQNAVKARPWFGAVRFCDRELFDSARRNVRLDTAPWWSGVRCPVLALYGDHDTSSGPAGPLIDIIRGGLEAAGNRDLTVHVFPGADHSLCRAAGPDRGATKPRGRDPLRQAGPDFVAGYVEAMTNWLGELDRHQGSRSPR